MKKILSLLISAALLSSCAFIPVHKMDIEQGNVVNQNMVNKLRIGMTQDQVKEILGTPVLLNTFSDNRVDYVYTLKQGNEPAVEYYITLTFRNGHLKEYNRTVQGAYVM